MSSIQATTDLKQLSPDTAQPLSSRKRALSVHSGSNSMGEEPSSPSTTTTTRVSAHESTDGKRSRSNSPVRGTSRSTNGSPTSTSLPSTIIRSPSLHDDEATSEPTNIPLPDDGHNDPDMYLIQLVEAQWPSMKDKLHIQSAMDLDYFPTISEEQMSRYNMAVVNLARASDVDGLRTYCNEHSKDALDCFNRFGEGLLNMACRRGFVEMVQLLLHEIELSVRIKDDYGRTPVHDACWNPEPQLQICQWLIERDPSLFLVADKRGYTPFQYARQSDWKVWREFLYENRQRLVKLTEPAILERFSKASRASN